MSLVRSPIHLTFCFGLNELSPVLEQLEKIGPFVITKVLTILQNGRWSFGIRREKASAIGRTSSPSSWANVMMLPTDSRNTARRNVEKNFGTCMTAQRKIPVSDAETRFTKCTLRSRAFVIIRPEYSLEVIQLNSASLTVHFKSSLNATTKTNLAKKPPTLA